MARSAILGVVKQFVWVISFISFLQVHAQQGTGDTLTLGYLGVMYKMYVPHGINGIQNKMRFLVMIHGTNGRAIDYLAYPLERNDPKNNQLIVIAPQFPGGDDNPWSKYDNWHVSWLNLLMHQELPTHVLPRLHLSVRTDKFYLFGHSKGGQYVQSYLMRFECNDIIKAAACAAGKYYRRAEMPGVSADQYVRKLKKLIQSDVAFIIGTSDAVSECCLSDRSVEEQMWDNFDCPCNDGGDNPDHRGIWDRQKQLINYFLKDLYHYLGEGYLREITRDPPEWHPRGATFPIEDRSGFSYLPTAPIDHKKLRFFWTPVPLRDGKVQQGHRGWRNYNTAKNYFFYADEPVPQPNICLHEKNEVLPHICPPESKEVLTTKKWYVNMHHGTPAENENFKITYTMDGSTPTFEGQEYVPGSAFALHGSTIFKAVAFNRKENVIANTFPRSEIRTVEYIFLNRNLPQPEFYIDPDSRFIVRLNPPANLTLGPDVMIWYNINQISDPLKDNNPPDLPFIDQIQLYLSGKYIIKARYYIRNNSKSAFEASEVATYHFYVE